MVEIWYAILSFMLVMFIILDGFAIGAGMLQYAVGKTDAERRLVLRAIGPLWTWHEVWLVAFGGTLFVAFPSVLASAFAGFYLAFFLLLWSLVLRGVSHEVSGHIDDPLWRTGWHFCFVASNILLAILIGAALGNVVRGVPLDARGRFTLSFFTNFGVRGDVGILDWYTVSVAVFTLVTLAAHGAVALVSKTNGPVHDRSERLAKTLWNVVLVLLVMITVESWYVRTDLFPGMLRQPFAWLGVAGVLGGLLAVFTGLRSRREKSAVMGSCAFLAGLMIAGAASVFPVMLHSTLAPENSLTAYAGAATGHGLAIALVWWPVALVLTIIYSVFIHRHYAGKVKPADDSHSPY
jgi:cytochrome bd ubiquinol oxidase subunit II